jgi:ornithine cyclodeaminase/alanine dehydrogenase-like protein (mu-crystallin family)
MTTQFNIPVISVDSAQKVVEESDIVISIAATMDPVIDGTWLSPGTTVVAAGPTTWRAHEVNDDVLIRADKIIVDSLEQAPIEAGDLSGAVDRGILQWSQLYELRHSVSKTIVVRDNSEQIIFAKLMGTGVADVCAAKLAYDNATTKNLGMELPW